MSPLFSVHSALVVLRVRLGPTAQPEPLEQPEQPGQLEPMVLREPRG